MKIWRSHLTGNIRKSIRDKECSCTNEIFTWPSIIFQPAQLAKSLRGARSRQRAKPLREEEGADYTSSAASLDRPAASPRPPSGHNGPS